MATRRIRVPYYSHLEEWSNVTFSISTPDGKSERVGWTFNNVIGVHRAASGFYPVTHLPTGMAIWTARKLVDAQVFARHILNANPEIWRDKNPSRATLTAMLEIVKPIRQSLER